MVWFYDKGRKVGKPNWKLFWGFEFRFGRTIRTGLKVKKYNGLSTYRNKVCLTST